MLKNDRCGKQIIFGKEISMRRVFVFLVQVVFLAILVANVHAGYKQLNIQGKLTDNAGNPITGSHDMYFKIYDSSENGTMLWSETHIVDLGISGLYNVVLGAGSTLLDNLSFNAQYYVAISVDGEEMTPRQMLTASPYALGSIGDFNAKNSISAGNNISVGNNLYVASQTVMSGELFVSTISPSNQLLVNGDIRIPYGSKYFFDTSTKNYTSVIGVSGTNTIAWYCDGIQALCLDNSRLAIPQGMKICLGSARTFLQEETADQIALSAGGVAYRFNTGGLSVPSGTGVYLDGLNDTYIAEGNLPTGNQINFYVGGIWKGWFSPGGVWYCNGYVVHSPDIKKDPLYKDKTMITSKDYLDWAVKDANKPIQPYDSFPTLAKSGVITKPNEFLTQKEVDAEMDKYSKDISKIAIGIGRWADDAEKRITLQDQEIATLKAEIELLKAQLLNK